MVVNGNKARCTCNGELLEAALAIPEKGPLALQSETNVVEYRNIRIKTEVANDPAPIGTHRSPGGHGP